MTKILGLQNRRTCSSCTSTDQGLSIPEKEEDDIEDKDKEVSSMSCLLFCNADDDVHIMHLSVDKRISSQSG
jgi:hypothetical protein